MRVPVFIQVVGALGLTALVAGASGPQAPFQTFDTVVSRVTALEANQYTDAKAAAAAPVQSVNTLKGAVAVPAYQRQYSGDMTIPTATGLVTWNFPTAFNNTPTCYKDVAATTTNYTFDEPLRTAISPTSVTYQVTAHPKTLTIASVLNLPLTLVVTPTGVPTGSTIAMTCIAPQ